MEGVVEDALAAIVMVTLAALLAPFGVITDGEKLHVARLGRPEHANEIACWKPLATATFNISCAVSPCCIVTFALPDVLMENGALTMLRTGDAEGSYVPPPLYFAVMR